MCRVLYCNLHKQPRKHSPQKAKLFTFDVRIRQGWLPSPGKHGLVHALYFPCRFGAVFICRPAAEMPEKCAPPERTRKPHSAFLKKWLGEKDSNLRSGIQIPESCRWTIPEQKSKHL
jgi:hypothetical protein